MDADRRRLLQIFILSAFFLYLEILLIRWISTEIRVFAYFKNLTLIACFFGMGMGALSSERRAIPIHFTFPLLALFCALVLTPPALSWNLYDQLTKHLGDFNDMPLWTFQAQGSTSLLLSLAALVFLVLIFGFIAAIFVPSGSQLGRLMDAHPRRIAAYSANVAGSVIGIWIFSLVAFMGAPPWLAFGVGALLGLPLLQGRREWAIAVSSSLGLGALFLLSAQPGQEVVWSPYQKLVRHPSMIAASNGQPLSTGFLLEVNGAFYQRAVDLSPRFLRAHRELWPEADDIDFMSYNLPYRLQPQPEHVLIVGAGTGNEVAAALRNGAKHIDAVEIDPQIVEFGRRYHPEHPYDDARVHVVVDDARSYFKKTRTRYDLIIFGALDSHTLSSSYSNIRIDNYVYTVDSFREAKSLLADRGIVWLVFSVERSYIGRRLRQTLEDAFGFPPIVFRNAEVHKLGGAGGGPTFVVDKEGKIIERIAANPAVLAHVQQGLPFDAKIDPGTDDWPYLYLEAPSVPRLYLIVTAALLLLVSLLVKPYFGEFRRMNPVFFFLGAAFLLVETQSISKMALLFGTTWIVSSVVISGVLTMILLANLVASKLALRSLLGPFAWLAAALLLNVWFPFGALLGLDAPLRVFVAGLIMSLPIFFAGLIFIVAFAREERAHHALASNLIGAIAGGVCESLSLVVGINALGLLALAFYLLALWSSQRAAHAG
jgi:hypothetical protein